MRKRKHADNVNAELNEWWKLYEVLFEKLLLLLLGSSEKLLAFILSLTPMVLLPWLSGYEAGDPPQILSNSS